MAKTSTNTTKKQAMTDKELKTGVCKYKEEI